MAMDPVRRASHGPLTPGNSSRQAVAAHEQQRSAGSAGTARPDGPLGEHSKPLRVEKAQDELTEKPVGVLESSCQQARESGRVVRPRQLAGMGALYLDARGVHSSDLCMHVRLRRPFIEYVNVHASVPAKATPITSRREACLQQGASLVPIRHKNEFSRSDRCWLPSI